MSGRVGKVRWKWEDKYYTGELIPDMETNSSRFARTHNGKIKKLPKKNYNA